MFVQENTEGSVQGIEEHYLGNESDQDAEIMKFKKPEKEIITTVHNHVLSMSIIFLLLGGLVLMTSLPGWLKKVLVVEPFLSIVLTFGGIWMMWAGHNWMKYIVIVSGMLLNIVFTTSVILVIVHLFKREA